MRRRKSKPGDISGVIVILIGIFCLVYSYLSNVRYDDMGQMISECTLEIQASINDVRIHEVSGDDSDDEPEEEYEFFFTYEVDGKEYSGSGRDIYAHKIGDTYRILCNPDDPNEWITPAYANDRDYKLSNVLVFGVIGIGCIGLGVVIMIVKAVRRDRSQYKRR